MKEFKSQVGGNTELGRVPKITSKRDERMKILVNSCISEVDRIVVKESRKSCEARLQEGEVCS